METGDTKAAALAVAKGRNNMQAIIVELQSVLIWMAGGRAASLPAVVAIVGAILVYGVVGHWSAQAFGAGYCAVSRRGVGLLWTAAGGLLCYAAAAVWLVPLAQSGLWQSVLRFPGCCREFLLAPPPASGYLTRSSVRMEKRGLRL
jgi:hypothetical protein